MTPQPPRSPASSRRRASLQLLSTFWAGSLIIAAAGEQAAAAAAGTAAAAVPPELRVRAAPPTRPGLAGWPGAARAGDGRTLRGRAAAHGSPR
jgi:hypothetical protein